jgi:D-glycero-D-manno-heptose 1,7-bisphosphate phosphatase
MVAGETGRKAVFFDRDGVIVIPEFRDGRSFGPRRIEDYRFYPEAEWALASLKQAGYLLIVVTNQPDVGHGLITNEIMDEMNRQLLRKFPVDAVKVCCHTQDQGCDCRKPKPGMLLDSAREFGISLSRSFMVGDRASDVEAGRAAGCTTVFIDLGYTSEMKPTAVDFAVRSVAEAADVILDCSAQEDGTTNVARS